ncbi:MAG: tetratricopeptide repeat protein, partial [Bacteroidota bacterium]|nr:tetratricopeptide repeat protein [Bacteroidota bacterium]MDX5430426.1 tetratricopeptide repeat protein [Bacteroidota bacterium]MDX5469185.1 tetratricopeptide repeat protein [Bacteroidota bacterium]
RMYGMALANKGPDYQEAALASLRKGIELLPEAFISYDVSGMILASQNKYDTAATLFQKSIHYKINYTNAHYNLGIAYYNLNNFVKAAEEFENCVKYGGQQPQYYKLLGICRMNMNQYNDAIQFLTFAAQNGNDPEAYHYLGQVYERQGNTQAAQQMYQKSAQLRGQ